MAEFLDTLAGILLAVCVVWQGQSIRKIRRTINDLADAMLVYVDAEIERTYDDMFDNIVDNLEDEL